MSQIKRQTSPSDSAIEEDERQYGGGPQSTEELDAKYPSRPHNHSRTLLFSELFISLFDPLNDNKTQPKAGPRNARKRGPHGPSKLTYRAQRQKIIERFMSRWRKDVGNDIYPAMRLICPDQDRERGTYGLKEITIGKLLVKLMKISKDSEDGNNLLKWKLPGQNTTTRMAGDFAGRCCEVLRKRSRLTEVGDMRIGDVNELLDKLAAATGEAEQLPIFETFYSRMNAEEMMWLIRIVLKQMKIDASDKTFLNLWHPDGYSLFNVSASLRHVCWELWDPEVSMATNNDETGLSLMQCFRPQLAQFQETVSFEKLIDKLGVTTDNPEFWIEEKLDGERMQMHYMEDPGSPGGFKFSWWSRKGKDYTYLYGKSFEDDNSGLTRHLRDAIPHDVQNCILDGEMIAWDPIMNKLLAFGTVKTAALSAQKNPFNEQGWRPMFRVFDMLYANGKELTQFSLKDRREAMAKRFVRDVPGRMEIHPYHVAESASEIEPELRRIVAELSEGLVLKNPLSRYRLGDRNNDWIKVKPEYLSEFGEALDCVVIGGYYGEGRRGGTISSFLCGLRISQPFVKAGVNPEKCRSFFKVGGGFKAQDYAEIRHHTDGKWKDWDVKNPPTEYIELAGGSSFKERPDVWIRPKDSVVISVKAASVDPSESFAVGQTLRFPRFRSLRGDKRWDSALDEDEFKDLKHTVDDKVQENKKMVMENRRHRRPMKRQKRELVAAGAGDAAFVPEHKSNLFDGLTFYVAHDIAEPRMEKSQLENLIKEHGGTIMQEPDPDPANGMIIISDKNVFKVNSMVKIADKDGKQVNVIRSRWVFDCLKQGDEDFLLPYEEAHLFRATESMKTLAGQSTDQFGDSYCRDVDVDELTEIFKHMPKVEPGTFDKDEFLDQLVDHGHDLPQLQGWIFRQCRVHFAAADGVFEMATYKLQNYVKFGGGEVVEDLDDKEITHVVVVGKDQGVREAAAEVGAKISTRRKAPRVVTEKWVEDCWTEKTHLDGERYPVG